MINARPADPSLKAKLNKLIEQLSAELAQTPPGKKEEAEAVAKTAQSLIETAAAEKPNRTTLRITGEDLKDMQQVSYRKLEQPGMVSLRQGENLRDCKL